METHQNTTEEEGEDYSSQDEEYTPKSNNRSASAKGDGPYRQNEADLLNEMQDGINTPSPDRMLMLDQREQNDVAFSSK